MSGIATALDHVGIAGADLGQMAEVFEKLGFTLTKPAREESHTTGNQCVMLTAGYLQLIAVMESEGSSATLASRLGRYHGAHIVALTIEDAAAALIRVRRAGLDVAGVSDSVRDNIRFATLPQTDAPEGQLLLIQHHTPDELRPARYLGHANHAVALREVVIATPSPADAAARFSRLAGRPVLPDPLGGFVLQMEQGLIRLLPPASVAKIFPGAKAPALPWIAGIVLETDDGNAALRRRLSYYKVSFQSDPSGVIVAACGVFLAFRGTAPSIPD